MKNIPHLSDIAGLYDGFILDLWGVVHDGVRPFPAVIETLAELKRAHKKIWLLSNAPKRAATVARHLAGMGITPDLYDHVHTSGEEAHMELRDAYIKKQGRRCLLLGYFEDQAIFEGLDLVFVETPEEADFIFGSLYEPPEKFSPLLDACIEKNLPMICANPDKMVHHGDKLFICPGTLAEFYEKRGGEVVYFGKPHRAVYARCLEGMNAPRVLAIGDGMPTDIAGATAAGLDSGLVVSGIHREEFTAGENRLQKFLVNYPFRPTYLMEGLIW